MKSKTIKVGVRKIWSGAWFLPKAKEPRNQYMLHKDGSKTIIKKYCYRWSFYVKINLDYTPGIDY